MRVKIVLFASFINNEKTLMLEMHHKPSKVCFHTNISIVVVLDPQRTKVLYFL